MPEQFEVDDQKPMCDRVLPKLSGVVDGGTVLSAEEQAHAQSCLQCQAELVRYRKLLRALHDLRTHVIHPEPGLLAGILDNLAERGEQHAVRSILSGRRAAYTGGIAVAAVAGITGAILLSGRARSRGQKAA